jgi:glycosyltransferase involved in cell wall biosynthesis
MRKPVIASRVGGVPEIIKQGESGWAINNDCVEDWVEKISLVTTDNALNRRLGDQGRRWVAETFGWKSIAGQVESILESAVAEF